MSVAIVIAFAVTLLLAFSIGLNLGLHGVLSLGERGIHVRGDGSQKILSPISSGSDLSSDHESQHDVTSKEIFDVHNELVVVPANQLKESKGTDNSSISALKVLNDIYKGQSVLSAINAAASSSTKGAIASFLYDGGKIPIVLLTCNRPDQLKRTLASLLAARGVLKENVIIAQDGAMRAVKEVAEQSGLMLIQNLDGLRLRGGAAVEGAERIAKHYKFSLSAVFDKLPLAPAIIIVEDDLLFSPDFYEYLAATAPILETDPTTFVVSAWNDNGFKGRVSNQHALRRTEFFPGLGWLLPRALYKDELEHRWPSEHWDHWLRSEEVHGSRDIVYPEVPRTFHNGIVGTFMNLKTHNKYFRDVDYNLNEAAQWDVRTGVFTGTGGEYIPPGTPNFLTATERVDEARVRALISACTHISSLQDLLDSTGVVCAWIDIDPEPSIDPPEFQPIASFFGIWHEHRRGAHRGLHEFHWEKKYVLILNIWNFRGEENFKSSMPDTAVIVQPNIFDKNEMLAAKRKKIKVKGYAASKAGMTCDQVCAANGLSCRVDLLPLLNTCAALKDKFPCRDCVQSFGLEQPAYVSPVANEASMPGMCLTSTKPEESQCAASHGSTFRLCACA